MINYVIDGNNLIGKIPYLSKLQKKDRQSARERLVFILDRYFTGKKNAVSLHLDGYPGGLLNSSAMKIIYSEKSSADEKIKKQIDGSASRKNIILISSDGNLAEYARVCSCRVMSGDDFALVLKKMDQDDEEESRIRQLDNKSEFLRLFGAGDQSRD